MILALFNFDEPYFLVLRCQLTGACLSRQLACQYRAVWSLPEKKNKIMKDGEQ